MFGYQLTIDALGFNVWFPHQPEGAPYRFLDNTQTIFL
jgi:hypothetical protein